MLCGKLLNLAKSLVAHNEHEEDEDEAVSVVEAVWLLEAVHNEVGGIDDHYENVEERERTVEHLFSKAYLFSHKE